jgi:phosphoribosylformylglycinamidine synthase
VKAAVVVFPGSNCDHDCLTAPQRSAGWTVTAAWHKDAELPAGTEAVILPGGFSYGDYLRCGAIASMSPVMAAVKRFAEKGGPVAGVCNGFQVLCESGLLPGTLLRNRDLAFICEDVFIKVESTKSAATRGLNGGDVLQIPIAHGDGNYFADEATLDRLEKGGQVIFRYCDAKGLVSNDSNPNGSLRSIAGISNEQGNVVGMMPHPDRASERVLGSADGVRIWEAVARAAGARA